MDVDPFEVPLSDKGDLLVAATQASRGAGADVAEGLLQAWDTSTWFVSSEGARIDQRVRKCGGGIWSTVVGEGETQRRSYPSHRGPVRHPGLGARHRARPARPRRARSPTRPAPCSPRRPARRRETDVVIGDEQLALQIHESVGHAIELDRILGWEAAYAGTSWLDLSQARHRCGTAPT